MELESLVVPEADASVGAGRLIEDPPRLWDEASLPERRRLLLSMLDGVYFDTKGEKALVAIRPKPAFLPIFQVAVTREGSLVVLLNEKDLPQPLPEPTEAGLHGPCSWWRRGGGVDLSLKRKLAVLVVRGWSPYRVPVAASPDI